jgi:beta-barrel assembly-enhancing protease
MKRLVITAVLAASSSACSISTQQEIELGQQTAAQVAQQLPMVNDPEVNRYINALGDSLASLTSRADLEWHFYVVNSREVNAFALPGGFIYVNRGLIERTTQMSELAGVLGHEIGHVTERHSVKQMEQMQKANVGVTLACILTRICENQAAAAAIQVGGGAVFAKFSRQDEAEADAVGFANVVRAGISPEGFVTMFQKLLEERRTRPSGVEAMFATHPLEEDRISAAQARINQLPAATVSRLSDDSRNYQLFKQRLQALPPPPPAQTSTK